MGLKLTTKSTGFCRFHKYNTGVALSTPEEDLNMHKTILAILAITAFILTTNPALSATKVDKQAVKACKDEKRTKTCKRACKKWGYPGGPTSAKVVATCRDSKAAFPDYLKGRSLYDKGDHKGALAAFQAAYKIFPGGALAKNIAESHDRLLNAQKAIDYYKIYLKSGPSEKRAEATRKRIEYLEKHLSKPEEVPKPEELPTPKPEVPKPEQSPDPSPMATKPSKAKKIAGGITLGIGGAALGTGVGLLIASALKKGELDERAEEHSMWNDETKAAWEDLRNMELAGIIMTAIGGTAVAVGTIILIIDRNEGEKQSTVSKILRTASFVPTISGGMIYGIFSF